jgi:hypothetical protein
MTPTRAGTFMKERPLQVSPKSSEQDPPAANQPTDGGDLGEDSNAKANETKPDAAGANEPHPADSTMPDASQVVPGKPDGEVDTRP